VKPSHRPPSRKHIYRLRDSETAGPAGDVTNNVNQTAERPSKYPVSRTTGQMRGAVSVSGNGVYQEVTNTLAESWDMLRKCQTGTLKSLVVAQGIPITWA
jgi:hypothetical protein